MRLCLVTAAVAGLLAPAVPARAAGDALERAREHRQQLEERVATVVAQLEDLSARVDATETQRTTLEAHVAALQTTAARASSTLASRAVRLYKMGDGGGFDMLFTAGDPMEAVARSRVLAGLGRIERESVQLAAAARVALGQKRAQLDELANRLAADRSRLDGLRQDLERAFRDARAREGELASRRSRQRQVSRSNQRGTYACPIARPFHFRDSWGAPRSGGRRHKGVDIFGPMGSDVYAFTNGVILRHSHSRLGGIGLYLRGNDGNVYYYAHLRRIAPGYRPGRSVEAGELIAYNGDTGNARGGAPHIHFEAHPGGGRAVNPYPYTAAACY